MQFTTIGLDLAKQVFQIHGVDAEGAVVVRKRLRRSEVIRFFSRNSLHALYAAGLPTSARRQPISNGHF
jgi:transposase